MADINVSNKRRRTVRKWMLLAITPIALAVVLYGVKVISMNVFADNSISSFTDGDMTTAQQNSERQKFANWFEDWKAYYNNGSTLTALGAYSDAIVDLNKALELQTDPTKQCDIRANLGIAYEGYGDGLITDKKFDEAQKAYDQAKKVLEESDESCSNPDTNPDSSDSIEQTKERLDGKGDQEAEPQEPEPSEEDQQKIQDQIDENGKERTQVESGDPSNNTGDFGPSAPPSSTPVDKPW